MSVATYTKSGAKATSPTTLDKSIFGINVTNHELLKSAYQAYLANGRVNLAKTKKRGEVRGGGKKPWRQKGTGRARFGSSRNPIWRGGGIAFGPTGDENYTKKLNTKAVRAAIRQALSVAAADKKISVIDSFDNKEGKVKQTVELLAKLEVTKGCLLVLGRKDDMTDRATSNVASLKVVQAQYLNVYDILNANCIVITKDSLDIISEWLGDTK